MSSEPEEAQGGNTSKDEATDKFLADITKSLNALKEKEKSITKILIIEKVLRRISYIVMGGVVGYAVSKLANLGTIFKIICTLCGSQISEDLLIRIEKEERRAYQSDQKNEEIMDFMIGKTQERLN